MAEQLQIRQVKLADAMLSFDGTALAIQKGAEIVEVPLAEGEANDLVWLLTGYRPRRGQKRAKAAAKAKSSVQEPATVVPGGDEQARA